MTDNEIEGEKKMCENKCGNCRYLSNITEFNGELVGYCIAKGTDSNKPTDKACWKFEAEHERRAAAKEKASKMMPDEQYKVLSEDVLWNLSAMLEDLETYDPDCEVITKDIRAELIAVDRKIKERMEILEEKAEEYRWEKAREDEEDRPCHS